MNFFCDREQVWDIGSRSRGQHKRILTDFLDINDSTKMRNVLSSNYTTSLGYSVQEALLKFVHKKGLRPKEGPPTLGLHALHANLLSRSRFLHFGEFSLKG